MPENKAKFIVDGNTIQKVYLSHSNNKNNMKTGDILLFYKTSPHKCLTAIGIVEKIIFDIKDRNIYSVSMNEEQFMIETIIEFVEQPKPTSLILFLFIGYFKTFPNLQTLSDLGVSVPQSIYEINYDAYEKIREIGSISSELIISDSRSMK